ncbi:MAG: hypothetical protein A2451_14350 [Bdellovibrionales bacterium RIFOXYC2_FULL_39_8]|nr:MAG: hypothetical protein A2451_14350 [Bdellovibrionales bacterium RIFOXYC2_FULL_39_8]
MNAKDAFENVKDHRAKKLNIITENAPDHKSVQIIFKDNASGIASEYVEKIFDPFFTTKCPNRGTGLGMTLSYEWVKEHNGTISCSSAGPGEGTTFFISLPTTIA